MWAHPDSDWLRDALEVGQFPDENPVLEVEKLKFSLGERMRANCTSRPSYPAANLTWFINGQQVETGQRRNSLLGEGEREIIPEKTRRPAESSVTISTRESPGTVLPGIEHGSPWRKASGLHRCTTAVSVEMGMEQRQSEEAGETGDPRENSLTSSIVQHDFHLRKSGVNRPRGKNPVCHDYAESNALGMRNCSGKRSWALFNVMHYSLSQFGSAAFLWSTTVVPVGEGAVFSEPLRNCDTKVSRIVDNALGTADELLFHHLQLCHAR
ncbi:hypothetical protein PR048_017863 [Dryococelus australis]|uniref:Ig-like domain-containing protein n=1 Tax=Dryococelus australis TaxID=614101 RepID=A0ABQ9HAM6_9NEOP|nr:hypothetical protein PR048_017863 [Dryococelus australis]